MLNIVVPMAGRGSRFADAGFDRPKPFIDVCGYPMIEIVIRNLTPKLPHRFVFIMQEEHWQAHDAKRVFDRACTSQYEVVRIDDITEGAAQTVLCAQNLIDSDEPLMIANSDQFVATDINTYLESGAGADGFLMTMRASDPKWSYAEVRNGMVRQVVEKQVISDVATVGIYNFSRGDLFVSAASKMIDQGEKSQGEYYVAPVYTVLAGQGFEIRAVGIGAVEDGMYGLGTPDDLNIFKSLSNVNKLIRDHIIEI